jgi:hypothetical protein
MATPDDLRARLVKLGLGDLFNVINEVGLDPTIDNTDIDQVARSIESNPQAQVILDKRFAGNKARIANNMQPLTPSEYINAENNYIDTLRNNGLPLGFYDQPEDLAKFIGGDVSNVELGQRIQRGYVAAQQAPASVREQLTTLYGINEAELAAYFLDPTKATDVVLANKKNASVFAQQIGSAEIAAQARQQAGMGLTRQQAESLRAQGVTEETAQQGFTQIGQQQGLFQPQMAGEQAITPEEQISGVLGLNAEAAQRIATRRRRRQAEFETGGGFAASQTGLAGLRTVGQ